MNKSKNKKNTFSIIYPVYNVRDFVTNSLGSILDQSFLDFEVIVIDDCGADISMKLIERFNDKRIKILKNDKNLGLAATRNRGIDEAQGEWIIFIDSDDVIGRDYLQKFYDAIQANPNIELFQCGFKKITPNGSTLFVKAYEESIIPGVKHAIAVMSSDETSMVASKAIKKKLFNETRIRFPVNRLHEDIFVLWRLLVKCKKICILSSSDYLWLERDNSITQKPSVKSFHDKMDAIKEMWQEKTIPLKQKEAAILKRFFSTITAYYDHALNNDQMSTKERKSLKKTIIDSCRGHDLLTQKRIKILSDHYPKIYNKFNKLFPQNIV